MGNSFLLIVVGLLLIYLVASDKFYCLEGCAACIAGSGTKTGAEGSIKASVAGPLSLVTK